MARSATHDIKVTLEEKCGELPIVPAIVTSAATPTVRLPSSRSCVPAFAIVLLILNLVVLVVLTALVGSFVQEVRPQVAPVAEALTTLSRVAEDLEPVVKPAVAGLSQTLAEVKPAMGLITSLSTGSLSEGIREGLSALPEALSVTFHEAVRELGPPESIPDLLTNAMSTHLGNLTSALSRIGRKLEPKLEKLSGDYWLMNVASQAASFFQLVRYLDGPIHEAEAEVFGEARATDLVTDGDIISTMTQWLGHSPVDYLVKQLDATAWNRTTASCHALRKELSIIMTKMQVIHPHMDHLYPHYIHGGYDEDGVYHPSHYALHLPPPPPRSPSPPPSPHHPAWCYQSYCATLSHQHPLSEVCIPSRGWGLYCSGCQLCAEYREAHKDESIPPAPPPTPSPYPPPSGGETALEVSLRSIYMSLAPVCLTFSTMA